MSRPKSRSIRTNLMTSPLPPEAAGVHVARLQDALPRVGEDEVVDREIARGEHRARGDPAHQHLADVDLGHKPPAIGLLPNSLRILTEGLPGGVSFRGSDHAQAHPRPHRRCHCAVRLALAARASRAWRREPDGTRRLVIGHRVGPWRRRARRGRQRRRRRGRDGLRAGGHASVRGQHRRRRVHGRAHRRTARRRRSTIARPRPASRRRRCTSARTGTSNAA